MKIGLLTYYGDLNCGTNLQAYATLLAIRDLYPHDEVEIIPFHGFRPRILPYISQATFTSLINDVDRILKYHTFCKEFLGIRHDKIITDTHKALSYISNRKYDVIYIGADTLLELDRLPKESNDITAYWLSPHISAKKILVAASCKNAQYDKLKASQQSLIKTSASSFAAWGVRDITTAQLLSHCVNPDKIEIIPDPTFTLSIDYSYIERYLKNRNITIPSRSICFHTYRTDSWANEVAARFKQQGYTIVSLRPAKWADIILNGLSPFEQLGVYRYFSLIITHRFHDTIFALKNGTPPLTYVADTSYTTELGESKCSALIKQMGLYPHHIIEQQDSLNAATILNKSEDILNHYMERQESVASHIKELAQEYRLFLNKTKVL